MRARSGGTLALLASVAALLLVGTAAAQPAAPAGPAVATGLAHRTLPLPAARAPGPRLLPAGPSTGQVELRADAHDPISVPNEGAEMNVTGFSPPTLPANSTFQVSLIDVIGPYQAVFGIFMNSTSAPIAFYALYGNLTDKLDRLVYWSNLPLYPGQGYLFAVTHVTSGLWQFTLNGVPFDDSIPESTVNLNATASTWSTGLSYAVSTVTASTFTPATVVATVALATLRPSGWYLPRVAVATTVGSLGTSWGIEGNLQHPSLPPGEVVTGPAIAPIATGAELWNGSAQPIVVAITLASATVPANGLVGLSVTATRPTGEPVPGAYLQLLDSAGSSFEPSTVETGPGGNASAVLLAPNASAEISDTVTARSSLLGFYGSGSARLNITAVVHVLLVAPGEVTVAPSATVGIDFRSTDATGRALGGIPLALSVNASALVAPPTAVTDASGLLSARVQAPSTPTTLLLLANVVGAGYWGGAQVVIHVVPPTPPWIDRAGPYLAYGAIAALAAVAILLVVRRARVPPQPLPPFVRDRRPPARPAGSGSAGGAAPPAGNDPPGPGQP